MHHLLLADLGNFSLSVHLTHLKITSPLHPQDHLPVCWLHIASKDAPLPTCTASYHGYCPHKLSTEIIILNRALPIWAPATASWPSVVLLPIGSNQEQHCLYSTLPHTNTKLGHFTTLALHWVWHCSCTSPSNEQQYKKIKKDEKNIF